MDFSQRVSRRWTLVQSPDARLRHHVSDTNRLVGEDIVFQRAFSRCRFFRLYHSGSSLAWPRFVWGVVGWGGLLGVRSLRERKWTLLRGFGRGVLLGWRAGSNLP